MKKKQSGLFYVYREAFRNDRQLPFVMLLLFCFRTLAPLVFAFAPVIILNAVLEGGLNRVVSYGLFLLVAGTAVLGLKTYFENCSFFKVEQLRSLVFTTQFLTKLLRVKYKYLEEQTYQNLIYSSYGVVNNERSGCSCILSQSVTILSNVVDIAVFAYFLIKTQNLFMIMAVVIGIVVNLLMAGIIGNISYKSDSEEMQAQRQMNYYNKVCLGYEYAKDVRNYPLPGFVFKKYEYVFESLIKRKKRDDRRITAVELLMLCVLTAAEAVFYLFLFYQNILALQIPNLFLFLAIFALLPDLVGELIDDVGRFFTAVRQTADLTNMLAYEEEPEGRGATFSAPLHFEVQGVSFHYPGSKEPILKDITLTIPQGAKIAIVGKNGSGKTTLIKLLLQLYDSYEGAMTLAGCNLSEVPKQAFYNKIGCLFQNSVLFASSVQDNVVLKKGFDAERFAKAMEDAGLTEQISRLPEGGQTLLNHMFSKDAVDLSGGEQQKLLFARILYQQPQIVILDEPTAAMDVIAEERFYSNIKTLLPKSTIIFISHRLSSTKFCDTIYVMEEGRIVESGSHAQLLSAEGPYSRMYCLQREQYQKEYRKVLTNE